MSHYKILHIPTGKFIAHNNISPDIFYISDESNSLYTIIQTNSRRELEPYLKRIKEKINTTENCTINWVEFEVVKINA